MYIDTPEADENKAIFDRFQAEQDKIEETFGGPLEWQRLDDRRASRIRHVVTIGGFMDRDHWPELQEALIDAMVRLEKALKPHIKAL